jgi:threonine/homoserine/homoserine lactone efflux protein
MVHVSYCILGLGLIISQSIVVFNLVKLLGAAYLMYVGFQAIRAQKTGIDQEQKHRTKLAPKTRQAFFSGFITNVLNPKVTLFFLSLFSVLISPNTPILIQFAYGLWMSFATVLWFSCLSMIFSLQSFRNIFQSIGHWFERTMGAILIALGIKLAFTTQK